MGDIRIGVWQRPRDFHPSEDLSELAPTYAGQVYHYRLTGLWRNSLPGLLWAGWTRWAPYMAVIDADFRLHRWSSRTRRIAFPLPGDCQLMGIRCRVFTFRGTRELLKVSLSSSFLAERIG